MYLGDIYTVAVNLCGLPGITVPCGQDKAPDMPDRYPDDRKLLYGEHKILPCSGCL